MGELTSLGNRTSARVRDFQSRRGFSRVAPEFTDPIGAIEVGEHQDVEQLDAGEPLRCVQALP
jgi:hypothetical protein